MSRKTQVETIVPDPGSSFKYSIGDETDLCTADYWHMHPEYEITYISQGVGKRHVGNHVSQFTAGDLIVMGPNVPHFEFGMRHPHQYQEVVIQMTEEFMEQSFFSLPETSIINRLKKLSVQGLSFHDPIKTEVGQMMLEMEHLQGYRRLNLLLNILMTLATSSEYTILNSEVVNTDISISENERISKVYEYIEQHYKKSISITQVADLLAYSVPYTCRFLKEKTLRTLTEIVTQFRISKACDLLANPVPIPIAEISHEVGFNNLSHFNKSFKQLTRLSPREYRKHFYKIHHASYTTT